MAAFWPPGFFSNNLANLDQLNQWMPFILLVYIPAITMSVWSEERRQHTDELLLTLPASDTDVVTGKFFASVAIYTVALLFSMFSIYLVFMYGLGSPDTGLFVGTYIGYWFVGLAMISIGMVASFLTNNLTVGFILGMHPDQSRSGHTFCLQQGKLLHSRDTVTRVRGNAQPGLQMSPGCRPDQLGINI